MSLPPPSHLQLYDLTTMLVEPFQCPQPLSPCNLLSIKRIELRKRHNDIITVARVIWKRRNDMIEDDDDDDDEVSPVHGFPVRNKSLRWMFGTRLSTLVSSPIKLSVKSSFCSDSQPCKFSIRSTLFMARLRYSSFFNLWRFSGSLSCTEFIHTTAQQRESCIVIGGEQRQQPSDEINRKWGNWKN
jgi:hypothetical protein